MVRSAACRWLPFEEAKAYLQTGRFGFTSSTDFRAWSKSGDRPRNIPSNPEIVYTKEGWNGFPDFLGYSVSKYDPLRSDARKPPSSLSLAQREMVTRLRLAQTCFLARFQDLLPEYELRQLSVRRPSMFMIRKRSDTATSPDQAARDSWIAVHVRFSSPKEPDVFRDMSQRKEVGVIFVADDASQIAFENGSELREVLATRKNPRNARLRVGLSPFTARFARGFLDEWWDASIRDSTSGWMEKLADGGDQFFYYEQYNHIIAQIEIALYESLDVSVRNVFALDPCIQGNLMLSDIVCLQRVARPIGRIVAGYSFNVNKGWYCGHLRVGEGWRGSIQRYICIVLDDVTARRPVIRGVFIFPKEFVFRSKCGSEQSQRGTLIVYPPFLTTRSTRAKRRQAEQRAFFIDFQTMHRDEQLAKAKELLGL